MRAGARTSTIGPCLKVLVQTNGWARSFQRDELLDGGGEFADVAEGSAVDGLAFDDAEPDLDEVHPGGRGRGEMDVDARVGGEPVADLDALVGGVVVHHQVQSLVGVGAGNVFEESQEFLMAVAVLADAGDLAGRELRRGEQVVVPWRT